MSKSYEDEQRTLSEKAKALPAELDKGRAQAVNVPQFIALVKKYSEIDTLTLAIVNEFIERINVHAPNKSSGKRRQNIHIKDERRNGVTSVTPFLKNTMFSAFSKMLSYGSPLLWRRGFLQESGG